MGRYLKDRGDRIARVVSTPNTGERLVVIECKKSNPDFGDVEIIENMPNNRANAEIADLMVKQDLEAGQAADKVGKTLKEHKRRPRS